MQQRVKAQTRGRAQRMAPLGQLGRPDRPPQCFALREQHAVLTQAGLKIPDPDPIEYLYPGG